MKTKLFVPLMSTVALFMLISTAQATMWATSVVDADQNGDTVDAARSFTSKALGEANNSFYSLGKGGYIIFSFDNDFGTDGSVFEITYGTRSSYVETANIFVSYRGSDFEFATSVDNQSTTGSFFSLPTVGPYDQLKIVDTSSIKNGDGFDIDAVSVNAAPVPEPATMLLFGIGLAGLAGTQLRRRKK